MYQIHRAKKRVVAGEAHDRRKRVFFFDRKLLFLIITRVVETKQLVLAQKGKKEGFAQYFVPFLSSFSFIYAW